MPMLASVLKIMDENFCRLDFALHSLHKKTKAAELAILCRQHNRSAILACNFCNISGLERELGGTLNLKENIYAHLPG